MLFTGKQFFPIPVEFVLFFFGLTPLLQKPIHMVFYTDYYLRFGSLDNISSFSFEYYTKNLKKILRKHEKPLQRAIRRYYEEINQNEDINNNYSREFLKKGHSKGSLIENLCGPQYHMGINL